jgi:hypothetical protein
MIIDFDAEHPIGSICRPPCVLCGDSNVEDAYLTLPGGQIILPPPLYIIRKASWAEFVDWHVSQSGRVPNPLFCGGFQYEVSTD